MTSFINNQTTTNLNVTSAGTINSLMASNITASNLSLSSLSITNPYYIFVGSSSGIFTTGGYFYPLWSSSSTKTASNLLITNFNATNGGFQPSIKGMWLLKFAFCPSGGSAYEMFIAKNPAGLNNVLNPASNFQDLLGVSNFTTEGTITSPVILTPTDTVYFGCAASGTITSANDRTTIGIVLLYALP